MNSAAYVGIALTAAVGLIAAFPPDAAAENATPYFEQYRVPPSALFRGTPAPPQFKTSGQRMFRTVIREATKKGPNFAGQYRIAEWGCGTGCEAIAIVDVKSGAIYDGPFGTLPKAGVYLGPNVDADETGMSYHLDSRLLVIRGCPNFTACGEYYYEWTGSRFNLLQRIPIKPLPGSELGQPGKP
jgi:hypothetical protein